MMKRHHRCYRVLDHLRDELDHQLEGMKDEEKAWLLAQLRAECWMRLAQLDPALRQAAEMEATSPLCLLRKQP